jgi:hypothetical protein
VLQEDRRLDRRRPDLCFFRILEIGWIYRKQKRDRWKIKKGGRRIGNKER